MLAMDQIKLRQNVFVHTVLKKFNETIVFAKENSLIPLFSFQYHRLEDVSE